MPVFSNHNMTLQKSVSMPAISLNGYQIHSWKHFLGIPAWVATAERSMELELNAYGAHQSVLFECLKSSLSKYLPTNCF